MIHRDTEVWREYCAAEHELVKLRMKLVKEAANLPALIDKALQRVNDRGTALRLLLALPLDASIPHLDTLVRLSCTCLRDIESSRALVRRLYEAGHKDGIVRAVNEILLSGGEDEFRRVAELYSEIDMSLLRDHLEKCAQNPDPCIQEISADFSGDNATPPG